MIIISRPLLIQFFREKMVFNDLRRKNEESEGFLLGR
jgi:hypothetical protein